MSEGQMLNEAPKVQNNFSVEFLEIPTDISDVLGRQVASITLPDITFQIDRRRMKGFQYFDKSDVQVGDITIRFIDDANGLVEEQLYLQVLRQLKRAKDKFQNDPDSEEFNYRFSIKVNQYNQRRNQVIRTLTFKSCLISNLSSGDLDYSSEDDRFITATFVSDNVDVTFRDNISGTIVGDSAVFPTRR